MDERIYKLKKKLGVIGQRTITDYHKHEEYKALRNAGKKLPAGVQCGGGMYTPPDEDQIIDGYAFSVECDLFDADDEATYIELRKAYNIEVIKKCAVFLAVVVAVSLVAALIIGICAGVEISKVRAVMDGATKAVPKKY